MKAKRMIHPKIVLRVAEVTREAYAHLPALVPRSVFLEWTGLNKNDLYDEVKAGRILQWKPPGGVKALYYKQDIGIICGWEKHARL